MRIPEFLQPGGTIGFAAPSFGCAIEPYKTGFETAMSKFSEMGYIMYPGPNVYKSDGIGISTKPEDAAAEFMSLFTGEECDVMISCGGGEMMCEILPYLDFEALAAAKPKWFMGYSDNTNLTFLLNTLADMAAIYGPCAPTFGMEPWAPSVLDAWETLTGNRPEVYGYDKWEKESLKDEEHPTAPYNLTEKSMHKFYPAADRVRGAKFSGRLLGGCLDILVNLSGTKYDRVKEFADRYREDGIIWFLEACDLNPMSVRRSLWNLREAGWFQNVKGFLIGRPLHFGEDMMGCDMYNAVTDILGGFGVPIIMDLDIGHLPPQMPIISGAKAEVSAHLEEIGIRYIL